MKSIFLLPLILFHTTLFSSPSIELTEIEQEWLKTKASIQYVYDPDWAPFEWTNEIGQHSGIILDLLKLIETRSGLKFKASHTDNWQESISLAETRHVDMYSAVGNTEQRKSYMTFSSAPIFSTNYIFICRKNEDCSSGFSQLENKKLAVVQDYTIHKLLKNKHPELPLLLVGTVIKGLNQLIDKKIDVLIVNKVTGNYLLAAPPYHSLKNAFETPLKLDLYIAIRNDWPAEAITIINKALLSISNKEKMAIYTKWIEARRVDYGLLIKVSSVLVLFILIFLLLNRKQASFIKQIKQQKKTIQRSLEAGKELEEKTQLLLASIAEGMFGVDNTGKVTFINAAALGMLQYAENEVLGKNIHSLIHHSYSDGSTYPIEDSPVFLAFNKNKVTHHESHVFWKKDGHHFPISYSARPLLKNKRLIGAAVTFSDKSKELLDKQKLIDEIADRKQSELLAEYARNKLEDITNNIPGVVYQLQITTDEIMVNFISDGITQLQYISPTQINHNFDLFINSIHSDDQKPLIEALQQSYLNLGNINFEYRVITPHKDIKWIHIEAIATKIAHEKKEVILFDAPIDTSRSVLLNGSLLDITDAKKTHAKTLAQQQEIERIHNHIQSSIEYAALIQSSLIPEHALFHAHFQDFFAIWQPKDTVGGDIYLLKELNENEIIIMLIDCTGHGIPGAFVTMLVKAIEMQLLANLQQTTNITPANILSYFNKQIKLILKQDHGTSISDTGFDGAVVYYNKAQKIMRFAGANMPIFIYQNKKLTTIKGDRHSIGYKKSDIHYKFTQHTIDLSSPTQIYLTTDGFLDQSGGDNGFSYGKGRFSQFLEKNAHETFSDQQELLLYELQNHQKDLERNDDITVIGLKI